MPCLPSLLKSESSADVDGRGPRPASYYGDNEDLLGKWFKRTGRRDDVFLATKFGVVVDSAGKLIGVDTSAAHVRAACDRSLARLGVDVIDLYYAHRVNRDTPIEETVRAMAALKACAPLLCLSLSLYLESMFFHCPS